MSPVRFSLRALRREWRSGELRILALSLTLAVAAMSAVGLFSERVGLAMRHQSAELLAADLVVESGRAIETGWRQEATRRHLRTAETVSFRSMVTAGDALQLAEVKAVGENYPLRGELAIADRPFAPSRPTDTVPRPGTAWADARLAQALALQPGDTFTLGEAVFRLEHILAFEPDRGGDLFSIAPRLLIHRDDLPRTGLLQVGSLVRYRLLLAGEPMALAAFRDAVADQLGPGDRLLGVREARPELRAALDRAERFLGLAALTSVLLAGVAAALAVRRYTQRHLDEAAVLGCLGAPRRFIAAGFLLRLLWLALAVLPVAVLAGYAAQAGLAVLLQGLFAQALPSPTVWPALQAALAGAIVVGGFAVPPLLTLKEVPPLRVLRREVATVVPGGWAVYGLGAGALLLLLLWQAKDLRLAFTAAGGAAGTLALLAGVAGLFVALLRRLRRRPGLAWRLGLANLTRRAAASILQIVAFGLGLMALLLLGIVRGDLLAGWRDALPVNAPNHFLIDIQPGQVEPLASFFTKRGLTAPAFHPMVRGRLVAIGPREVSAEDYLEPRAKRLVQREFNLSWAEDLRTDNRVVAGQFWRQGDERPQWSVEEGLARTLGIELGQRLVFQVGGRRIEGPVTSLRAVDWDSFRANFFVLAPRGVLDSEPASYITSFYRPPEERSVLPELVRAFPTITVIDVEAIMTRVRGIMDRVTLAVEFVFGATLLAGLLVLWAAIQATQGERLHEGAVLRTLGASRRQLLSSLAVEFITLGTLAGAVAAVGAIGVGFALAEWVLHIDYRPTAGIAFVGILGGAGVVGLAGLLGTRPVVRQPPLWVLRRI